MKTRTGFVANSSSSSFIINKRHLSNLQIACIREHRKLGISLNLSYASDWSWYISEDAFTISGETYMNNFSMREFMEIIGVDNNLIKWEED